MQHSVALFTATAVRITSARATLVQIHAREAFTPFDPFVVCLQHTLTEFPHNGNPATQQLRDYLHQGSPKKGRQIDYLNTTDIATPAIRFRGLVNTIETLGTVMGTSERAECQDDEGVSNALHDEFVWIEDVAGIFGSVCDEVNAKIE